MEAAERNFLLQDRLGAALEQLPKEVREMSARDFLSQSRTNPAFNRAHDLRTDAECYDEVSRQEAVDTKAATREEEV